MTRNIKWLNYRLIFIILCIIAYLLFNFTKITLLTAEGFRNEASQNLSNFGIELFALKEELKSILNQEPNFYEVGKNKSINWYVLHSLNQSNSSIKAINGGDSEGKIIIFYMDTNIQIEGILQDRKIDSEEKRYLEELNAFTKEVIAIYKKHTKISNTQSDTDYFIIESQSNKKVYNMYEKFFKETDQLFLQDKYEYLRLYDKYEPNNIRD